MINLYPTGFIDDGGECKKCDYVRNQPSRESSGNEISTNDDLTANSIISNIVYMLDQLNKKWSTFTVEQQMASIKVLSNFRKDDNLVTPLDDKKEGFGSGEIDRTTFLNYVKDNTAEFINLIGELVSGSAKNIITDEEKLKEINDQLYNKVAPGNDVGTRVVVILLVFLIGFVIGYNL